MATALTTFVGDPFAELGVPSTASHDDVRRAFRQRARETHPDHQPHDPHAAKRFARLRAAYDEALERIKRDERDEWGEHTRARAPRGEPERARRGRTMSEHELTVRVQGLSDASALRRVLVRHGHRAVIGATLARNPAFPTDALPALRRSTERHWTVDAAIADRADVPDEMLLDIARLAREPIIGIAVAGNAKSTSETLDALVHGPVRMDTALENAVAAHPDLSIAAAARLAGRYATNAGAVLRLIERGDLPEELVQRLASQNTRPLIAAAAHRDLLRRGLQPPPQRIRQRPPRPPAGYWR